MRRKAHWILALTVVVALVTSASALAGALRGKTYEGFTASTGTNTAGRHLNLHPGAAAITLSVSRSGGSVTVRFPSHYALLYCVTSEHLFSQSTSPARISSSGAFRATVGERFASGGGPPPVTEVVTGRFTGRTVKGTIRTEAPPCGGTTSFSATVH